MESLSSSLLSQEQAASAFASLGSEQRLAVVLSLVAAGPSGASMGDLAARTGIGASTLTHHLRFLTGAGLVNQRRAGRSVICTADFAAIRGLSDYLLLNCCADAAEGAARHDHDAKARTDG